MWFSVLAIALMLFCPSSDEDLRELSGLTERDAAQVSDDQPFNPSNSTFKRLLYRTGTVDASVLAQWSSRSGDVTIEQLKTDPQDFRFFPLNQQATATSVDRFEFGAADAKDFLRGFYVVACQTSDGKPVALLSRSSIESWPQGESLPEPQNIRFDGFFLGNFSGKDGKLVFQGDNVRADDSIPVFVTRRFSWKPTKISEELNIDEASIALAGAGVDIALLDVVRSRKGKRIGTRESSCYWQMMAACKTADPGNAKRIDLATMLQKPLQSVGKAVSIQGRVRQCVPVKATSPEAIELIGSDTWYQLSIFPDLGGRPIAVAGRDGEAEIYKTAFPVTVCVIDLPNGLNAKTIEGKNFLFDGFVYRIWSYSSQRTENSNLDSQPSPLIMASSLLQVKSTGGQLKILLGAIVLAIAIAIGFICWFVFKTKNAGPRTILPDKIESW